MKLSSYLLAVGFASLATARLFGTSEQQNVLDDDENLTVPGDNPMEYCVKPDDDILKIDYVDIDPNPPLPGQKMHIKARGNFTQKIEEGAYVFLTVKWGLVRLIYQKVNLCEQMKEVDKECPLEKGSTTITKDVDLPEKIPPGTFHVIADAYTHDEKKITCLMATVEFNKQN